MATINLDEMGKLLYNVCSREKHKTTKIKEREKNAEFF